MLPSVIASEVPPKLIKGKGIPVRGRSPEIAAIFINACTAMPMEIPAAISFPNVSGAYFAMCRPLHSRKTKRDISIMAPRNPVSSEKMAKIESPMGSGKKLYFCTPFPNPSPKNPPDPIAISDWLI